MYLLFSIKKNPSTSFIYDLFQLRKPLPAFRVELLFKEGSVSNLARKRLLFGRLLVRLQCTKPPLRIRSYVLLVYQNTCINSTKNERIGGVKSGKTAKNKGLGGAVVINDVIPFINYLLYQHDSAASTQKLQL